jgi:hypothetical protein
MTFPDSCSVTMILSLAVSLETQQQECRQHGGNIGEEVSSIAGASSDLVRHHVGQDCLDSFIVPRDIPQGDDSLLDFLDQRN